MTNPRIPEEIVSIIIDINDEHVKLDENFENFPDVLERFKKMAKQHWIKYHHLDINGLKRLYRYTFGSTRFSSRGVLHEFAMFCIAYSGTFTEVFDKFCEDSRSNFNDLLKLDTRDDMLRSFTIELHLVHVMMNGNRYYSENDLEWHDQNEELINEMDIRVFKRLFDNSSKETLLYELLDYIYLLYESNFNDHTEFEQNQVLVDYAVEISEDIVDLDDVKDLINSKFRLEIFHL